MRVNGITYMCWVDKTLFLRLWRQAAEHGLETHQHCSIPHHLYQEASNDQKDLSIRFPILNGFCKR